MAKVAKVKKREPTVHSRAHRRNASPPPKELTVKTPAVADGSEYKPWLHNAQNAGISKKKRSKQMTRQQKVRQQKAMEKADANLDKLATKVDHSKARGRKVQARRVEWEELNGAAVVDGAKVANGEEDTKDSEAENEGAVELDEGMADPAFTSGEDTKPVISSEAGALPEPEDDEEL